MAAGAGVESRGMSGSGTAGRQGSSASRPPLNPPCRAPRRLPPAPQPPQVRQRFAGETIHLTAHVVVARPPSASSAPIEGVATFEIPELGLKASKALAGAGAKAACGPQSGGAAGAVECSLFIEVRPTPGAWLPPRLYICSALRMAVVGGMQAAAGLAVRLHQPPPPVLSCADHRSQVQGRAVVAPQPRRAAPVRGQGHLDARRHRLLRRRARVQHRRPLRARRRGARVQGVRLLGGASRRRVPHCRAGDAAAGGERQGAGARPARADGR